MQLVCLDLEGVLIPEIWINVADKIGVEALKKTTRDMPDYDELMRYRLALIAEHGLTMTTIEQVISTLDPLPGACEFLAKLREQFQVIILSDTFYEFAKPLMVKLGYPTLLCHQLIIDDKTDQIVDYRLRQKDPKKQAVLAFQQLNFNVLAAGDSFNDVSMLQTADAGAFLHAPESISVAYPELPAFHDYDALLHFFSNKRSGF